MKGEKEMMSSHFKDLMGDSEFYGWEKGRVYHVVQRNQLQKDELTEMMSRRSYIFSICSSGTRPLQLHQCLPLWRYIPIRSRTDSLSTTALQRSLAQRPASPLTTVIAPTDQPTSPSYTCGPIACKLSTGVSPISIITVRGRNSHFPKNAWKGQPLRP